MAIADVFIGCRSGNMTITHGAETKHINLYPPTKPLLKSEDTRWVNEEHSLEIIHSILTISHVMSPKENTEKSMINYYISNPDFSQQLEGQSNHETDAIANLLELNFQEHSTSTELNPTLLSIFPTGSIIECGRKVIEISLRKTLNISDAFTLEQENQLKQTLEDFLDAFSWEYTGMRGIYLDTCIHHIYMEGNAKPMRQPQRRMNPALREIVKDEH